MLLLNFFRAAFNFIFNNSAFKLNRRLQIKFLIRGIAALLWRDDWKMLHVRKLLNAILYFYNIVSYLVSCLNTWMIYEATLSQE